MDARAADALFNGSLIALVAAATTAVLDLFGFVNVAVPASFVLGSAAAFAFAAAGAPEWQWIAAGALVGIIGGIAIDRLALDPLRRRGRNADMLPASIGMSLVVYGLSRAAFSVGIHPLPHAVALARMTVFGPLKFSELQALAVVGAIAASVILHIAVRKTRFGNGVRAACANPLAAQLMGMRIDRVPAAAMAATTAMAAVAGALYTVHTGYMSSGMPSALLLSALAAVVLAPRGSVGGVCIVAYALSFAGAFFAAKFPWLPSYSGMCVLAALIAAGLAWRSERAAATPATAET
jgi:branched-chain amino acid transport system permease protein